VTFTNKAAGEMRERVGRLLSGHRGAPPLITTFHSLGVRLLREFHETAGIPRGFSIWDQDDSTRAVKTILKQLDTEEWTPRQILSGIGKHYAPEDIVGHQAVFVTNLEPRVMMGMESQGMLLAASNEETLALVGIDKEITPGAAIH